ncbi:uncharacterized protein AC631_02533 [Debaryomyces fabryi]|uniref:Nuclear cap-binding protein complex subunit 1 n=1 Tax=Debaryomyces fabryi TaxID=58627 RepID=A0A0V1PZP1_9ASCO|nr:uncharacterized protein AC631_02533 [Debaryomyces fabryi]KSA01725.1 hypothetical protein AC631_02533 [Debaryomyces fabryi]CUM45239.1 unnamed protein product [Debaryomyces fabryi]
MDSFNSSKRTRDEFERDNQHNEVDVDSKKQHLDPTTELVTNVCKDIRRIGENANLTSQIDDISYISNPIVAEFEKIDKLRVSILNTLYSIIIEQPQKITSLSILILLCNAKNFLVSKYVIEFFHSKAQGLLDKISEEQEKKNEENKDEEMKDEVDENEGKEKEKEAKEIKKEENKEEILQEDAGVFNNLKSILKFLACLSPIIDNYSVINVFKQFLNLSIDLQKQSETRNGIAEEIFYNTLISVPYLLSNDTSEEAINHCNDLLEIASNFRIKDGAKTISLLQPFDSKLNNFSDKLPYNPEKMINVIYPSLVALQGEGKDWANLNGKLFLNFKELIDPIIETSLKNNVISNEIVKHSLPQLSLPSVGTLSTYKPHGLIDNLWYRNTRILFQVYNTTEFETVPAVNSYFGLVFKDLAFDILTNLSFNKNETAIQLSILDLYFAKNLFAPAGSSVDQLTMINNDNVSGENNPPLSTWKIEDIAVESILTMIFQLPNPLNYEIYYYTVLIACCRESPESIAPVFGRAIRFFYNNLETLDYELKIRYLDWMTIQISNFEFSWKWDEWVKDSQKFKNLKYHPKKNFIKNLIAKEVRLSNKNRIKESFVTVNPDPAATDKLILLDEFYQYLNISLFPNESKYIIDYDNELYGNNDELKEVLAKLEFERKEKLANNLTVSPQEELIYNFSNSGLPLHEVSNKVYDLIIANWKPNSEFYDLYKEISTNLEDYAAINSDKFLINLFFQTYAYIGSRSIYSVVSLLSRDIIKLKFLSGVEIKDENYQASEFQFPVVELTEEQFDNRQNWIIDSIFRIWVHQPQVVFLILEYLIEFEVLKPKYLIGKTLNLASNLIIENVSCMESVNRVLINFSKSSNDEFKILVLKLFELIVKNLNEIASTLGTNTSDEVSILKDFSDEESEDIELMNKVDNQWLFYEYKGLLKSYLRKFSIYNSGFIGEIEDLFKGIENEPVRNDTLNWLKELQ